MQWAIVGLAILVEVAPGQQWPATTSRSPAGSVAIQQALLDLTCDNVAALVASHPDDRYLLPAVWLRYIYGHRIEVLLATRGGGGQNSTGPETGDSLERIRTLEAEAGCAPFSGRTWYLNRPDGGFRRSAEETFAEWGRESARAALHSVLDEIQPDLVLTTHHREEPHGHDLALVDLLVQVVMPTDRGSSAHTSSHTLEPTPSAFFLGACSSHTANTTRVNVDRIEPVRGATLRRLAHDILCEAHRSPGSPAPIEAVFEPELSLEPQFPSPSGGASSPLPRLPSVFDEDIWPGSHESRERLHTAMHVTIPTAVRRRETPFAEIGQCLAELRTLAATRRGAEGHPDPVGRRLARRIEALERLMLLLAGVQVEVQTAPGVVAIAGEEFVAAVRVLLREPTEVAVRAEGLAGVGVDLDMPEPAPSLHGRSLSGQMAIRMPGNDPSQDPMGERFRAPRFVPPVQVLFHIRVHGVDVPTPVTVLVEQRNPLELTVVPRMLLLPSGRDNLQFSVGVVRHSQFPVESEVEVRAPAGYVIDRDRHPLSLSKRRSELFAFAMSAPLDRRAGVDVVRVRVGEARVALPVHKVEVRTTPGLEVALLRNRDDTLPNVLGVGGLGVDWSELSDTDLAVADLARFDSIVVDVRALRDRPDARRSFRRLLEFATRKGKRLVVFYHKDVEFDPPGEGFVGAPFEPFEIGRRRVTRPDAPVQMLLPDHPLLQTPNVILPGDWDGWEQERALYLPQTYGPQFEEVLAMQDPGEPLERGALLYAKCGDGEYVYCALALWRQLKKLHPGAVRLLANLLTPARQ
jgi:hypothetical protein